MLTAILWIIAAAVVLLLVAGAMRPPNFSVVREALINAPPERIFAFVNDFRNWSQWSPWEKMDPNMNRNFAGPSTGVGAKYSWNGNKKVGEGSMEITHSEPSRRMQLDLHFVKPFKADNVTEFTLTPQTGGTHVRWEMRGTSNFMMRVMQSFLNMDKMVGKDFESGLANLKGIVEK